jgi:hypothetical protein
MDFVSSLRPEHLQSFWYSASKYNFALVGTFISLLWATATTKEEADTYRKSLDEYRWVLRLSSKSADFLERAIGMMAASTGVLVKAIPDHPDADRILSRNITRLEPTHTAMSGHSRHNSYVPSMAYRSESELHDENSPENLVGETPSDSGVVGASWNADQAWLGALGDISAGYEEQGLSSAYLGLTDAPIEFDYNQNS